MRRIEEARQRLRIEGKEVKAVRRAQRLTTVRRSTPAPRHDVS
ncbi:MAG TPA: hypothetical protein VF329_05200 [Gammaproteobacteria bacterium]